MTNGELTRRLQDLQAQTIAVHMAVRFLVVANPAIRQALQQAAPTVRDALLAQNLTDSQIEAVSRHLHMLAEPLS